MENKVTLDHHTNVVWMKSLQGLYQHGEEVTCRGLATKECLGAMTVVPMDQPVVTIKARNLGYRFMAAEAWWILTGDNRVETIAPYSKKITDFSDDGETFNGAYGPPISLQLRHVTDTLIRDPESRQAYITIWRPCPVKSKDIPCTTGVQFLIRNNELHVMVDMRSSDVWLGWPYDVFNFAMLGLYVLLRLRDLNELPWKHVNLGKVYHFLKSQHLYVKDIDKVEDIFEGKFEEIDYLPVNPVDFETANDLIYHLAMLKDRKFSMMRAPFLKELQEL